MQHRPPIASRRGWPATTIPPIRRSGTTATTPSRPVCVQSTSPSSGDRILYVEQVALMDDPTSPYRQRLYRVVGDGRGHRGLGSLQAIDDATEDALVGLCDDPTAFAFAADDFEQREGCGVTKDVMERASRAGPTRRTASRTSTAPPTPPRSPWTRTYRPPGIVAMTATTTIPGAPSMAHTSSSAARRPRPSTEDRRCGAAPGDAEQLRPRR